MSRWGLRLAAWTFFLAGAVPVSAQDDGEVLRVMSFNVRLGVADDEGTFNGFGTRRPDARIDSILHSPRFDTVSAAIDTAEDEGRFPPDHFPVTAVVGWKD